MKLTDSQKLRRTPRGRLVYILGQARARAGRNGYEYDLDLEWCWKQYIKGCPIREKMFDLDPPTRYQTNPHVPSIDRIDSRKGYTKDNCRMISWCFNQMMSDYEDADVAKWSRQLATYLENQNGSC